MSTKFNCERVVCPDKYFLTVCAFSSKLRVAAFPKQQNKLILTLNSFRNGALFGIQLEVIEALSSPLAKCRKSRAQSSRRKEFAIKWHSFPRLSSVFQE